MKITSDHGWELLFAIKRKQVHGASREFGGGALELLGLVNLEGSGEWRAGRRFQSCRRDPTHVRQCLGGAAAQKTTEKILARFSASTSGGKTHFQDLKWLKIGGISIFHCCLGHHSWVWRFRENNEGNCPMSIGGNLSKSYFACLQLNPHPLHSKHWLSNILLFSHTRARQMEL